MAQPVFLLAFAYDPTVALPEVGNELNTIDRLLTDTEGQVKLIWQVTQPDLEQNFDRYRDQLRLFHYAGHAGNGGLELNSPGQPARLSFAAGLAGLAAQAQGLKLVFLNGCSTEDQVPAFLDRGISAVIATTKPLQDRYAVDFARRFYQNFTRRNSNMSLQQAFDAAFYSFIGEYGSLTADMLNEQVRGSFKLRPDANEPLYELHLHPAKKAVAGERFADWLTLVTGPDYAALKKEIQSLISSARLEEALKQLAAVLPDAIQLQQQYSAAKRENLMGMLDTNEWFKLQNQVSYRALELAKTL